jgi:hypothetical protein
LAVVVSDGVSVFSEFAVVSPPFDAEFEPESPKIPQPTEAMAKKRVTIIAGPLIPERTDPWRVSALVSSVELNRLIGIFSC